MLAIMRSNYVMPKTNAISIIIVMVMILYFKLTLT